MNLLSRCHIPDSLESVTDRSEAEVDPRSVGATRAGVARIWEATCGLYRSGMHPAVQLCIRRHGEVVLDRAIGHAAGNGPEDGADVKKTLATTETPTNIFSASKAITAMVIHLLDQKHLLHVHDPVTEYIPEFGKHGKDRLTIEHVLTHRAGIPNVPPEEMKLEYLMQPEQILQMLDQEFLEGVTDMNEGQRLLATESAIKAAALLSSEALTAQLRSIADGHPNLVLREAALSALAGTQKSEKSSVPKDH